MAANPNVKIHLQGDQRFAKYTDGRKCFHHAIEMEAQQPFSLVTIEFTSGPYKGKQAVITEPTPYFPFERLLPELRQTVYKLVFTNKDPFFLGNSVIAKYHADRSHNLLKWTSLLRVNRAIGSEAKEVLWQSQHFIVDSMASAIHFLEGPQHGGRKYITRLTVKKSGPGLALDFYLLLTGATRLRCLTITLPSKTRMSLSEHIDKHYRTLICYLAPKGVDRGEVLRRLDTVCFDIGPAQRSVLDDKGESIKVMTPELNSWCRDRIRGKLLKLKQFSE